MDNTKSGAKTDQSNMQPTGRNSAVPTAPSVSSGQQPAPSVTQVGVPTPMNKTADSVGREAQPASAANSQGGAQVSNQQVVANHSSGDIAGSTPKANPGNTQPATNATVNSQSATPQMSPASGGFHLHLPHYTGVKDDFFDQQNEAAAKKKAKNQKNSKIALIVLAVVVGVLLVAGAVWLTIILVGSNGSENKDSSNDDNKSNPTLITDSEGNNVSAKANDMYFEQDASMEDVEEYFQKEESQAGTEDEKAAIQINQMLFYDDTFESERAIELSKELDYNRLTPTQKNAYCVVVVNAYLDLGEVEEAEKWGDICQNDDDIQDAGLE